MRPSSVKTRMATPLGPVRMRSPAIRVAPTCRVSFCPDGLNLRASPTDTATRATVCACSQELAQTRDAKMVVLKNRDLPMVDSGRAVDYAFFVPFRQIPGTLVL